MFQFCDEPDDSLDPGSFKGHLIIAFMNNIGGVGPWQRCVLYKCHCDSCTWFLTHMRHKYYSMSA